MAIVLDGPEGALVTVSVLPRAARTEYAGVQGDALKFRVAAPPVEGAANEATNKGALLSQIELMQGIQDYNEVDCKVMMEIVRYLRPNH